MKSLLLSFFFVFFICINISAQWTVFHSMPNASWAGRAEFVDENVCWGVMGFSSGAEGFFRTSDGGTNWYYDSLSKPIRSICPINSDTAYIGTYDASNRAVLVKTTDGGVNWLTQSSAFGNEYQNIEFIHFFDSTNGFAMGDIIWPYFEMYTTTNGGDNWNRIPNSNIPPGSSNEYVNNLCFAINGDNIWFPTYIDGGTQIRIFNSTDRGYNWSVTSTFYSPTPDLFPTSIAFSNQQEGFIILSSFWKSGFSNSFYQMHKTTDGGITWSEIPFTLPIRPVFMCCIKGTNSGYVVSAPIIDIGSAYTLDGGNTWELLDNTPIWDVDFLSNSAGWAFSSFTTGQAIVYKWSGPPLPVKDEPEIPTKFELEQNYPNPFNPSTTFRYSVPQTSKLIVKVYDILGNEVSLLMDEEKSVGTYEITWNAENLPSGVYFYQIKAGDYVNTKKMVLLK